MADYSIKEGATSPRLIYPLRNTTTNLAGAVVTFTMQAVGNRAVVFNREAALVVALVPPSVGFDWSSVYLAPAGFYRAEFRITFPDRSVQVVPSDRYLTVDILPQL